MFNVDDVVPIFIVSIILIFVVGFAIGHSIGKNKSTERCMSNICIPAAIENGCGEFNSKTGIFEWKKN